MRRGHFRRLHFKVFAPCQLDKWCLWICVAASGFSAIAASLAMIYSKASASLIFAAPALLTMPWLIRALAKLTPQFIITEGESPMTSGAVARFANIGVGFWLILKTEQFSNHQGAAIALIMLFMAQASFLRTYRQDSSAIMGLIAAGFSSALAAIWLPASWSWLLLLIGLWLSATGLTWIHARISRRRLGFRQRPKHSPEENADGLWSRAFLMAMLIPIALVVGTAGRIGLDTVSGLRSNQANHGDRSDGYETNNPWDSSWGGGKGSSGKTKNEQNEDPDSSFDGSGRQAEDRDAQGNPDFENPDGGSNSSAVQKRRNRGIPAFPTELTFKRGLGTASLQDRLRLRVIQPKGNRLRYNAGNPLYLLCSTYDRFGPNGLAISDSDTEHDYSPEDGNWANIRSLPDHLQKVEFEIWFQQIRAPGTAANSQRILLPRLEPLQSVRLPSVRYSPNGAMTRISNQEGVTHYSIRAADLEMNGAQVHDNEVLDVAQRFYSTPDQDAAWQETLELIRQEIRVMDLSQGKIRGVLAHFRRNYRYTLQVTSSGPSSIANFLRTREGYCTYFATAAALSLRELGVPARVAAGYKVTHWDEILQTYVAGADGAHSWVEVPVRGKGWVTLDPTPGRRRENEAWTAKVLDELFPGEEQQLLETEVRPSENAQDSAVKISTGGSFWPILLLALSSVLSLATLLFRARRGKKSNGGTHYGDGKDDGYRRLLRLLSSLGFRKHRSETPLEFAENVVQIGGEDFLPLLNLTWMRYRTHFGGAPEPENYWQEHSAFENQLQALSSAQ